jgi:hypothetical protein
VPAQRTKFTALLLFGVLATVAVPMQAQELAGLPPLPVWRMPPADVADPHTVIVGHFDGTLACDGARLLKSTLEPLRGGPAGFGAVRFPAEGAVSIHGSAGFDPAQGTIELWLRPGPDPRRRRDLFSLSGAQSLDGDTLADLFVGGASPDSSPTFSQLYFGQQGLFDRGRPALIETRVPRGMAAGDLDGDGIVDLVITAHADDRVDFVPGPLCAGRRYERPDQVRPLVEVVQPQGLALADLEGDGDLDLVVCSFGAGTHPLMIFENDGSGGMTLIDTAFGGWLSPAEGLALADFDRDGVLDVVFATLGRGNPSAVVFGSLEQDGSYRLVVDDPERRFGLVDQALGVSVADLDGDGWQDIVLARVNAHELAIHLNRRGRFEREPDQLVNAFAPFTVCAARDLNNDGWLDLVLADFRQGALSGIHSAILFGPDYREQSWFQVYSAVSFTIGDMNGDGLNDVFWRSGGSDRSRVFFLDVDGETVGTQHLLSVPSHPSAYGAGVGALAVNTGGTSPYGAAPMRPGSFELYLDAGLVHFAVTDRRGRRHVVSAPFRRPDEQDSLLTLHGYERIAAEWSAREGVLELRVGNPLLGQAHAASGAVSLARYEAGGPIEMTGVSPVFRLGTDPDNQYACNHCAIGGFSVSTRRRSLQGRE